MMRRHPSKDMAKATVRMTKAEYKKVIELSGDLSISSFLMAAIRKAILAAELDGGVQKEELASGLASPGATAADFSLPRTTQGCDESHV